MLQATQTNSMQTIELHPKRVEALNKGPETKAFFCVSEDGKWFMHKLITTTFRPLEVANDLLEEAKENQEKILEEEN